MSSVKTEEGHECKACSGHSHTASVQSSGEEGRQPRLLDWLQPYIPSIISAIVLLTALVLEHLAQLKWFKEETRLLIYLMAYMPVAIPIFGYAWKAIKQRDVFSEFTLMIIATLGAFYIGEYPEGVAVMLFYTVGELFQGAAVRKARGNIRSLLDLRADSANVIIDGEPLQVEPANVEVGQIIRVRMGEKVPLDGILNSDFGIFNASALTGESIPQEIDKGKPVLAGMINTGPVVDIRTTQTFSNSAISRILNLVENAATHKAPTELFIRKFSRVYTPIVVFLAIGLTFLPFLFVEEYVFNDWFYRALVFLVISCPCALVISIPLGYFGGIGAASRNGILVKGSNYLDVLTKVNTVVMDKTGTLTKGVFTVKEVNSEDMPTEQLLSIVATVEENSKHPIGQAIRVAAKDIQIRPKVKNVNEIPGHGIEASVDGVSVLVGNKRLLERFNIMVPTSITAIEDSHVLVAREGKYTGYITVADQIKEDSSVCINSLLKRDITPVMLSGDNELIVKEVASELGISKAYGGLLPEHKVEKVNEILTQPEKVVAFVGDGINDAPVLAFSDVGIAMGGMGSDVAIETADVVIQSDRPSKIPVAIEIAQKTKSVVVQNIALAFGVKLIVLLLGAGGIASMWEAVFADVGVALLAILNAIRIQKMNF